MKEQYYDKYTLTYDAEGKKILKEEKTEFTALITEKDAKFMNSNKHNTHELWKLSKKNKEPKQ